MPANNKQTVKIAAAVGLLLIAVIVLVLQRSAANAGKATGRYYMNLATGELITGPLHGLPNIDAPGGPAVLAHVYSCGTCDEGSRQIVYLESLNDQALAAIANEDTDPTAAATAMVEGLQMAAPPESCAEPQWFANIAPESVELTNRPSSLCQGAPAKPCLP